MPICIKKKELSVPCIIRRGKNSDYRLLNFFLLHCVLKYFGLGKKKRVKYKYMVLNLYCLFKNWAKCSWELVRNGNCTCTGTAEAWTSQHCHGPDSQQTY